MNLTEVKQALDRVNSISGSTAKKKALSEYLVDETFRNVMKYALDPYVRFNITMPTNTVGRDNDNGVDIEKYFFETLDQLASRKLTGNQARQEVDSLLDDCNEHEGQLFARIVNKDLRAGFTKNTVNKIVPKLIPDFEVMRAKKFEPHRVKKWPVAVEPKLDGVRILVRCGEEVNFYSRTGHQEFASLPHLEAALRQRPHRRPFWLDAEITVPGNFNDTVSAIKRSSEVADQAILNVFDIIDDEEFCRGASYQDYGDRRADLIGLPKSEHIKVVPVTHCYSVEQIHDVYEHYISCGLEGVIVKPFGHYWRNKRSFDWMKIKAEETEDLKIVGTVEGTKKYEGMLGCLVVERNGIYSEVGSGFSDEERARFWIEREDLLGKTAEVFYHEITPAGKLRHARFKRLRSDK